MTGGQSSSTPLAGHLLEHYAGRHPTRPDADRLEASLGAILERARQAWPGVSLDAATYLRYLGERLAADEEPTRALDRLHTADLYLACACVHGAAGAADAFEQALARVERAVRRVDSSDVLLDEVKQLLRRRLLWGDDGHPRIREYEGRGPIGGWLRAAAIRGALNLRRGVQTAGAGDERLLDQSLPAADPELDIIKIRYREDLAECFRAALAALSAKERNMLRLYLVNGAGVEEIAGYMKVHRTTVTRWIGQCRRALSEDTRRRLRARLRLSKNEAESLIRVLQSQMDIRISEVLAPTKS